MKHDVTALGNALVDLQARVSPEFLRRIGVEPGFMTLVDAQRQELALRALKDVPVVASSGGSAANTVVGVAENIRTIGLYRTKARNVVALSRLLLERHGGEVPGDRASLEALPGVGRKTANVVLGNAFGIPGIACDTHVLRLSRRLQLSENSDDPVKLEFDLDDIVPKKDWTLFSHLLIFHGRRICVARKPNCPACSIAEHCPAANRPDLW